MENKVFALTPEETGLIERLNYIYQSHRAMVSVLAREFGKNPAPEAKAMLEDYCQDCQRAFIELRVAQDAVLAHKFPDGKPDKLRFVFRFDRQEVECKW